VFNNSKQILRERILKLLRNQKEDERLTKSLMIKDKLFQMWEFQKAKTILFYASFNGEVRTFEMMSEAQKLGKTIGLPRMSENKKSFIPIIVASLEHDLEQGTYGVKQPKSDSAKVLNKDSIDLVIVPGVAFDQNNNRLGRGGGDYDRFLAELPPDIPTIGLAFDFQMVDKLSHQDSHDKPVSCVLVN
jgi:5-formyltetrahydrofolate cyclo-ligase